MTAMCSEFVAYFNLCALPDSLLSLHWELEGAVVVTPGWPQPPDETYSISEALTWRPVQTRPSYFPHSQLTPLGLSFLIHQMGITVALSLRIDTRPHEMRLSAVPGTQ